MSVSILYGLLNIVTKRGREWLRCNGDSACVCVCARITRQRERERERERERARRQRYILPT